VVDTQRPAMPVPPALVNRHEPDGPEPLGRTNGLRRSDYLCVLKLKLGIMPLDEF